jgi:uncharacterized membrane protein YdjX (TVP38/TMEM64 family)
MRRRGDAQKVLRAWGVWVLLGILVCVSFAVWEEDVRALFDRALAASSSHRIWTAAVLFAVLASDIFLPVPSCLVSTLCGTLLGFFWGTGVSCAAMTLSATAGYVLGRGASALAQHVHAQTETHLDALSKAWGPRVLLLLRPVPVLAECSLVYAGFRRFPVLPCLFWTLAGNAGISLVYAALGAWGRRTESSLPAFGVVVLFSAIALAAQRLAKR